jgi:hypothetical protein
LVGQSSENDVRLRLVEAIDLVKKNMNGRSQASNLKEVNGKIGC